MCLAGTWGQVYNPGTNPGMPQSSRKATLPLSWAGNSLGSCELPWKMLEHWRHGPHPATSWPSLSIRHLGDIKHGLEPTVIRCPVLFPSSLFLPLFRGPPFTIILPAHFQLRVSLLGTQVSTLIFASLSRKQQPTLSEFQTKFCLSVVQTSWGNLDYWWLKYWANVRG